MNRSISEPISAEEPDTPHCSSRPGKDHTADIDDALGDGVRAVEPHRVETPR